VQFVGALKQPGIAIDRLRHVSIRDKICAAGQFVRPYKATDSLAAKVTILSTAHE
jgi:hypothetical protein